MSESTSPATVLRSWPLDIWGALHIDHIGYVYWKGHEVEHYTPRWAYTDEAKRAATELSERCKHLEAIGEEVNCRNAIWKWEDFVSRQPDKQQSR